MPDLVLLGLVAAGVLVVGAVVLAPLRGRGVAAPSDELEPLRLRYRITLEALRDVEADRRAGTLDDTAYAEELDAAERLAQRALAELEQRQAHRSSPAASPAGARRVTLVVASVVGVLLVLGAAVPPPVGLAARTVVNEQLAAARAAEEARQARIAQLEATLREDPRDRQALSDLADAHLAGDTADDLALAAAALLLIINLDPEDEDAYRRIITAYLRAGDYANAAAALESFRELDPDEADVAFFEGLIALRGEDDPAAALEAFDRFLELAPDDDRAAMVRALRADAADASDASE